MPTGNFIGTVDLALISLYVFWLFFFGLIIYLRREDKREGYPLENTNGPSDGGNLFAPPPSAPKTFKTAHGDMVSGRVDRREIKAEPSAPWDGAPIEPTGDPMIDGIGPASYAERADTPDMTLEGEIKIVPLRIDDEHFVETTGPNPIGMPVIAADEVEAGEVVDVWVDRSEVIIRYLEVEVGDEAASHRVLLPMPFVKVDTQEGVVRVQSIVASQFKTVPALANPNQVTFLEEDKITGYYAGGYLYADPDRAEPII